MVAAAALFVLSGCVTSPLAGGLYTDVKWDGSVANPTVTAQKIGTACATGILGLVATGDASIEAAKRNGNITKVATVDRNSTGIAFFYAEYCTIVSGE